jgi:DNA-directed RNA polymerase subunit RPC12/RpoP
MAQSRQTGGQLTTWVCLACSTEMYSRGPTAGRLLCPRCGGSVFRPSDTPSPSDQLNWDYLAEAS